MKRILKLLTFTLLMVLAVGLLAGCNCNCGKKSNDNTPPAQAQVRLDRTSLDMNVSDTFTLTASVINTTKSVTWSTNDATVATVSQSGLVTAIGGGSAIITATVENATATCTVTVVNLVPEITLEQTTLNLDILDEVTLNATVKYTTKPINWSSDNSDVVTVNQNGEIVAVGIGSATVTAEIDGVTATCTVVVTNMGSRAFIQFDDEIGYGNDYKLTKHVGDVFKLPAKVMFKGEVVECEITFESADADCVSVDGEGQLTANALGSTMITVEATYDSVKITRMVAIEVVVAPAQ